MTLLLAMQESELKTAGKWGIYELHLWNIMHGGSWNFDMRRNRLPPACVALGCRRVFRK